MARQYDEDEDGAVWTSVAAGVVIGVAVGGILGLLFAPKPGRELREDLKDRAEQAFDDLQNAAGELSDRTRDIASRTRENLAHSLEAGREVYARTRDELTARLDS